VRVGISDVFFCVLIVRLLGEGLFNDLAILINLVVNEDAALNFCSVVKDLG
jgi:hypothetical protein